MARTKASDKPGAPTASDAPESYTVLARRYRPQTFEEVVGQEAVARALTNAIKSNRVAHAYLFTGARGVGKTTSARILAKCLNCEHGPTPTPCGVCDPCRGIASGDDVDVLEIDAASNRGIDEIRNLRSNVQYRPSRARYKIYIIDEVHMLTREAFNALLKTLEEPPPHVKFFFATTDPQKIPITILSRCQRFDLSGISQPLIKQRLAEIVAQEGMHADDEALDLIARRGAGSLRDAQSLLDQLLAFGGDRLTAEQVHKLLGTASEDFILTLAEAILAGESARVLQRLDEALAGGFQMGELLDQLMGYWRDLMVLNCAGAEKIELNILSRHREQLTQQARGLQLDTILAGLDVLSASRGRLQYSSHGRTVVEMALVRLSRLGQLLAVGQLSQMLGQLASGGTVPPASRPVAPPEGLKKNLLSPTADPPAPRVPVTLTAETLPQVWGGVLVEVGGIHAKQLERAGLPAIFGPNALALRFPPDYNGEQTYCQEPNRIARVEEVLRKVLGRPTSLRIEGAPAVELTNRPTPPLDSSVAPSRPRRNPKEDAEKEPLIRRALDVLGAQIVRADEDFGTPTRPENGTGIEEVA